MLKSIPSYPFIHNIANKHVVTVHKKYTKIMLGNDAYCIIKKNTTINYKIIYLIQYIQSIYIRMRIILIREERLTYQQVENVKTCSQCGGLASTHEAP